MTPLPPAVHTFLAGPRLAVAGVSRDPRQAANAIFRKLRDAGYDTVPINPNAHTVEGSACYPSVAALPEPVDGVVIATHPDVAVDVVRECADAGVRRVWLHRSFGQGSVSDEAVRACADLGVDAIVGGCPLMFCAPVDGVHRCMRWWLQRSGRVPA